jgi:hypothetical protein
MISTSPRARRVTVLGLIAVGVLSACGSSQDLSDDVASLGSSAPSDSTAESVPTSVDPQEAFTDYTKCMRDEGIDMPDPQVISADAADGGQGGQTINVNDSVPEGERPNVDFDSDEFEAADKKCKPILDSAMGQIEIDPEVEAEHRQEMLEFAKCMRDHGIDFPDPKFSDDGGISIQVSGPEDGEADAPPFDPSSDEFQAASDECGDFMDGGFVINGSTGD